MSSSAIFCNSNLLLKLLAAVYLAAFLSFYLQIPGLYGVTGVLPAHVQLVTNDTTPLAVAAWARPTLLWWSSTWGLKTAQAMELLGLAGTALSLIATLLEVFRNKLVFALLLVFYSSVVHVGQEFLFFQWDTLLLETGLLAVLLAPWLPAGRRHPNQPPPANRPAMWLFRWLLFRVVFSTAIVKMQSHCPEWWGLTALETYFESQALPTPLAVYAHHMPRALLRITTVFSIVGELAGPLLMFLPSRALRRTALYVEVFLLLNVLLTGNYGFHTLLLLVLCVSLLDNPLPSDRAEGGVMSALWTLGVLTSLLVATVGLFGIGYSSAEGITARIAFSKADFDRFTAVAVPQSVLLAIFSFLFTAVSALMEAASGCGDDSASIHASASTSAPSSTKSKSASKTGNTSKSASNPRSAPACRNSSGSLCARLDAVIRTLVSVLVAAGVFACSLVPYTMLDVPTHRALPRQLRAGFAQHVQNFHLFGSYGLFKQMTGVEGRPEVVLEGADVITGPWRELHFRYKPGDVSTAPVFVAPHQPRLDWQMWLAALGDYHANPWLTALAYRILTHEPAVLRLLDRARYPFPEKPPKYVRALRYKYHYSQLQSRNRSWWVRDADPEEYLPIYSADHRPLLDYLHRIRVIGIAEPEPAAPWHTLIGALNWVRAGFDQSALSRPPHVLIWAVLLACLLINLTRSYLRV